VREMLRVQRQCFLAILFRSFSCTGKLILSELKSNLTGLKAGSI
jgi:hypothetical protein